MKLYNKLVSKLEAWAEGTAAMLPNFIVAFLIIVVFWVLSLFARRLCERTLGRLHTNKAALSLMSALVRFAVFAAGFVIALGVLNLDKALASILAGAGVVGLALGFAFQDLAGNMISGVGLAINKDLPFKIGDIVETNDILGIVREIHLRTSLIDTLDGKRVIIPNKEVYQNKVINYSANNTLRVDVECGISYGDDLGKAKSVATKAIQGISGRDANKNVEFFFKEFGSSSINFIVRFWVEYTRHQDFLNARSEAVLNLKKAFDEHDIMIPFPIRTLDFGIRGGEKLSEVIASTSLQSKKEQTGKTDRPKT